MKNMPAIYHYINGAYVPSANGKTFTNINPYTGEPLGEVADGTAEEVDRAVRAARSAFVEGPWGRMTVKERLKIIRRIAERIEAHSEALAHLETTDTGLPISQTKNQAARAAENFRFYASMVESRLIGEAYRVDDAFINYTIYKPLGVVGLITPWNAPLMLETWKIAPALATGNTVVLKPAEWTPLTAHKLTEIMQEAGVPEGVFNVVYGFGETAGEPLVKHPDVRLISFTGETTTGIRIIKNAADTLKKTSMELGGKSPAIIFADADLDRALDAIVWGIFSFNGERCTANSRVFLERSIYHSFVEKLKSRVQNIRIGDPLDASTELGPLIHREHRERVQSYIDLARREGAEVFQGALPPALEGKNFIPATLLLQVQNEMRVAQEEIFGPVLAVMPFDTEEEVIRLANDVKYGLAAYVWTGDVARAHRLSQRIESGMVWVNSQNVRDLRIPFGGTKYSGLGREGGHYSFEAYTEVQVIHVAMGHHSIPQFGK